MTRLQRVKLWLPLIALVILVGLFAAKKAQDDVYSIKSFEDCKAAGYPIMESYPEQCRTPDGRLFVRKLTSSELESGIRGEVRLGPTCPVIQNPPAKECEDRPYQADFELTTADGFVVVKRFSSDAEGKFEIIVEPGEYAIRDTTPNVLPSCGKNGVVPVDPDEFTEVIVFCDTGIR